VSAGQPRALVLAAGQGRRFGGAKLHALYRGRPLLQHVLDVVALARTGGLIQGGYVVVGPGDDRARTLSHGAGLDTIINEAPEHGLSHSLRLGLAAIEGSNPGDSAAALVFLGDQPLVRLDVIEALVARWTQGGGKIIRPRYQESPEVPGHPALLARTVWHMVDRLQGDSGFALLLDSSSLDTLTVNVPGDNPDIDTRADLLGLEEASR